MAAAMLHTYIHTTVSIASSPPQEIILGASHGAYDDVYVLWLAFGCVGRMCVCVLNPSVLPGGGGGDAGAHHAQDVPTRPHGRLAEVGKQAASMDGQRETVGGR
jgi:hypothetical protein